MGNRRDYFRWRFILREIRLELEKNMRQYTQIRDKNGDAIMSRIDGKPLLSPVLSDEEIVFAEAEGITKDMLIDVETRYLLLWLLNIKRML